MLPIRRARLIAPTFLLLLFVAPTGAHAEPPDGETPTLRLRPGISEEDAVLLADWRTLAGMAVRIPESLTRPPVAGRLEDQNAIGYFPGPYSFEEVVRQIEATKQEQATFGRFESTNEYRGVVRRERHWEKILLAVKEELDGAIERRYKAGDEIYAGHFTVRNTVELKKEIDRIGERSGLEVDPLRALGDEYRKALEAQAPDIGGTWRSKDGTGVYQVQVKGNRITWTCNGTWEGKKYTHQAEGYFWRGRFHATRVDTAGAWVGNTKDCSGVVSPDGRTITLTGMNRVESVWVR